VGSAVIRRIVERDQPELVLCGHIQARGVDQIGRTHVVNPGPTLVGHYAIIDVDGELSIRLDGDE